jgi:hypothetical protein
MESLAGIRSGQRTAIAVLCALSRKDSLSMSQFGMSLLPGLYCRKGTVWLTRDRNTIVNEIAPDISVGCECVDQMPAKDTINIVSSFIYSLVPLSKSFMYDNEYCEGALETALGGVTSWRWPVDLSISGDQYVWR